MKSRTSFAVLTALVMTAALIACRSGGGGDGQPQTVIAVGAMTQGSVVVNGVTFDDTGANIHQDDTGAVPALADGKIVKVKGTISDDGLTGQAQEIEVENEVRGSLTKDGPGPFVVNGQTVMVDGSTVFAGGVTSLDGLVNTDKVEVHGHRDATGMIHATRVERLGGAATPVVDEVRGTVRGVAGTAPNLSFSIGGMPIVTNNTTSIGPSDASITDGTLVEVHLSGSTATRIEVEDLEDDEFRHGQGQEFEVEGLISELNVQADTLKVGGESVEMNSGTRFEGGIKDDLANDVKVEAEGHNRSSGGALIAEKITFKENIRIEAVADAAGSANALGLTVKTTSRTRFEGGLVSEATITIGDGLRIRGFMNLDGTITATRVIKQNLNSNGRSILQGPARDVNSAGRSFKIAGITINATEAQSFNDDSADSVDDNAPFAALDEFFAATSAKTMIVKARGIFTPGTPAGSIAADEVEIE